MALPLLVKVGEIRHRQHRWASPWWAAEQGSLQPVFVPILPKRPRDSGSFSSLQILVNGSKTDRATAGDLPQPQAHIKLQSKNFFDLAHGQSPGWQADPPFRGGGCLPLCCPAPLSLWKSFRRSRTRFRDWPKSVRLHRGIGVRLHPGTLFGIIPECRSASSRNRVHLAPDSAANGERQLSTS